MGRTNNVCESFNKTFSSVVGHANPTIYNFLSAVQMEQASTEGKIKAFHHGKLPDKRKKTYEEKDAAFKSLVSRYYTYKNNVFQYLDELAEL